MTKEEIVQRIYKWEEDMGESFNDYFSHDYIDNKTWASFLRSKGFADHANQIIKTMKADNGYVDQEELYHIYPEHDEKHMWIKEGYEKNMDIMGEFLATNEVYHNMVTKFFKKYDKGE
jgi:hypothetical protein